jgi:hypothetical protein
MPSRGAIFATFLLSLAVWLFFYIATPRAPLNAAEIAVVVAVSGAIVLGAQQAAGRFRKKTPANDNLTANAQPAPPRNRGA